MRLLVRTGLGNVYGRSLQIQLFVAVNAFYNRKCNYKQLTGLEPDTLHYTHICMQGFSPSNGQFSSAFPRLLIAD